MSDRSLGTCAIFLAIFMFWQSYDMVPNFSYEPLGPRAFPLLLSLLIALCGFSLIVKNKFKSESISKLTKIRILFLSLILFAYAFSFIPLGFIISTSIAILAIGYLFKGPTIPIVLSSISIPIILYYIFDHLLEVVLPAGILGFLS